MPDPEDNEFAHGTNHSNLKGNAEAGNWERVCVGVGGGGGAGSGMCMGQISGKSIGQFQSQVSAFAIVNQDSKTRELFT